MYFLNRILSSKRELKEEKALNKLNLKHLNEMEQTLNNERVEYTKTIENLNNTNKEKDEWKPPRENLVSKVDN